MALAFENGIFGGVVAVGFRGLVWLVVVVVWLVVVVAVNGSIRARFGWNLILSLLLLPKEIIAFR